MGWGEPLSQAQPELDGQTSIYDVPGVRPATRKEILEAEVDECLARERVEAQAAER